MGGGKTFGAFGGKDTRDASAYERNKALMGANRAIMPPSSQRAGMGSGANGTDSKVQVVVSVTDDGKLKACMDKSAMAGAEKLMRSQRGIQLVNTAAFGGLHPQ
jgi:hypothetical protein